MSILDGPSMLVQFIYLLMGVGLFLCISFLIVLVFGYCKGVSVSSYIYILQNFM